MNGVDEARRDVEGIDAEPDARSDLPAARGGWVAQLTSSLSGSVARKAELEAAYTVHNEYCEQADLYEAKQDYRAALQHAEYSLPTLPHAITFQRRFLKNARPALPAVARIIRLAPPLFARRALDVLAAYIDGRSKTERTALPDLPDQLAAARRTLAYAVRLWSQFNDALTVPAHALDADPVASEIIQVWFAMGLIFRTQSEKSSAYRVVTNPRRDALGKCPGCGALKQAPLLQLLEPLRCPSCNQSYSFVVLRRVL